MDGSHIQTSDCKHQTNHNLLPPGKRELEQLRHGQRQEPQVKSKVERRNCPSVNVDVDARSGGHRVVKGAPGEADGCALEDDGREKGDARGYRDAYCDVDGRPKARKNGKGEKPQVEAEDGQFGEHVDECVVEFQVVNQLCGRNVSY